MPLNAFRSGESTSSSEVNADSDSLNAVIAAKN